MAFLHANPQALHGPIQNPMGLDFGQQVPPPGLVAPQGSRRQEVEDGPSLLPLARSQDLRRQVGTESLPPPEVRNSQQPPPPQGVDGASEYSTLPERCGPLKRKHKGTSRRKHKKRKRDYSSSSGAESTDSEDSPIASNRLLMEVIKTLAARVSQALLHSRCRLLIVPQAPWSAPSRRCRH